MKKIKSLTMTRGLLKHKCLGHTRILDLVGLGEVEYRNYFSSMFLRNADAAGQGTHCENHGSLRFTTK